MPSIFEAISQLKGRIKILEKISLLTLFLLMYLVERNNFLLIKSIKRIKTIKEVFDVILDKDKIITKTFL